MIEPPFPPSLADPLSTTTPLAIRGHRWLVGLRDQVHSIGRPKVPREKLPPAIDSRSFVCYNWLSIVRRIVGTAGGKQETATMMGPSADGKHWVNNNHRCACGQSMPLPQSEGMHCPKCGKREPTHQELQQRAREALDRTKCRECGAEEQHGSFCTGCGTKLVARQAV